MGVFMISLNISLYEVIEALKETGRITTDRVHIDEYLLKYWAPASDKKNAKLVEKYIILNLDDDSLDMTGWSKSLEDCNCEDD